MKLLFNILTLAAVVLASHVIELNGKNFKSVVVDSKIPTLVDIYASWCGHCKNLEPVYEELAGAFAHAKGQVQIVKIDGDEHRKISKKYGVTGFPSIKFFNKDGSVEEVEVGRDFKSLSQYITDKTGIRTKIPNTKASAVESITDENFDEIVNDVKKVAIVAFTAEWCGHCKSLKPIYKQLAEVYKDDENVVIGEINVSEGQAARLQGRFKVNSFPTILAFPFGELPESSEDVKIYQGARTLEAFTDYVNALSGVNRAPDGSLNEFAGRYATLDMAAKQFVKADSDGRAFLREKISKFMADANEAGEKLAEAASEHYLKYADKIEANKEYLEKEIKRLSGITARGGLKKSKIDELTKKLNILRVYFNGSDGKSQQKQNQPKAGSNDEL